MDRPGKLNGCPDRETLVEFNLGRLPDAGLEAVAGHLAACPHCGAILHDLQRLPENDTVVSRLRECLGRGPALDGPGCARLEEGARVLAALVGDGDPTEVLAEGGRREPPLPRSIGPYEVLGKIGHGGMGVVYRALQPRLNRVVALKMVLAGAHAGPHLLARFRTEGQACARLQHANVVQVFEFGEHDGLPYYSMELVEGGSLAARLADGPLPPREAAALVQGLASGAEFAHRRHVLHRDLKPANVLLASDGVPKIADFGLAKLLDADDGHTRTDGVLGTPSYMAPEQADGRAGAATGATDVYALGAILYEALTGRPPFRGPNREAILQQVRTAEPVPPSRRRPGVPRDLDAVCLKCLEKDPQHRYASAQALADDLERWLEGKPTWARPRRWPARLAAALGRRAAIVFVALFFVVGAAAFAAAWAAGYLTPPGGVGAENDPDAPLREIEAELAAGRAVPLIGQTGRPRWSLWRIRDATTQTSLAPDGTFTVNTWSLCLLELLPDPGHESYRITAQIRHDKSELTGEVGIYLAHRAHPRAASDVQLMAKLSYNDVVRWSDFTPPPPPKPIGDKVPRLKGNYVALAPYLHTRSDHGSPWDQAIAMSNGELFDPAGPNPQWRPLEVIVTPAEVRWRWDDKQPRVLSAQTAGRQLGDFLGRMRERKPDDLDLKAIAPSLDFRGALGLCLYRGSASFRDVTVEPLRGAGEPLTPPGGP